MLTAYRIGIQFSIVTHWNTVSIANPILSKEVIPALGPAHFSRQTDTLVSQMLAPQGASDGFPMKQGDPFSPSLTISSVIKKLKSLFNTQSGQSVENLSPKKPAAK